MGLLDGRVVLVSGVGRGLGMEVARAVLREGGRVVLGDRLEQVVGSRAELDPAGDRSVAVVGDLTDPEARAAVLAEAKRSFGGLDALVHVAAADRIFGGLMDGSLDDWDLASKVNVKGTLALTKAAVPLLEAGEGGSVVFIGALAAIQHTREFEMLAYGASKGALRTAAWYLSRELGPRGIRVNTVAPGYKWGPVLEQALQDRADAQGVDIETIAGPIRESLALGRIATDADVADAVIFFCSEMSRSITGQTLHVDAGRGEIIH